MLLDAAQLFAILGSYGTQLGFECVRGKVTYVIGKYDFLDVQLILDDLLVELT